MWRHPYAVVLVPLVVGLALIALAGIAEAVPGVAVLDRSPLQIIDDTEPGAPKGPPPVMLPAVPGSIIDIMDEPDPRSATDPCAQCGLPAQPPCPPWCPPKAWRKCPPVPMACA